MKAINFSDLFIILTMIIFGYIMMNYSVNIEARIVSAIMFIGMSLNFIRNLKNRIKLIKIDMLNKEADNITLSDEKEENKIIYNQIRQRQLENRVEKFLLNNYKNIHLYKNVEIIKSSGDTTEIDILAIVENKIFVIECKNYNVELKGKWSDKKLETNYITKKLIDNPVYQNEYHIEKLSKFLYLDKAYFGNIVVFGDDTKFPIDKTPKNTMICKLHYLDKPIKHMNLRELDEDTKNNIIEELNLNYIQFKVTI